MVNKSAQCQVCNKWFDPDNLDARLHGMVDYVAMWMSHQSIQDDKEAPVPTTAEIAVWNANICSWECWRNLDERS